MIQQDFLPNFLESEATARESTIPKEATIRHLRNEYYRLLKQSHKNNKCAIDNIIRIQKVSQWLQR